MIQPARPLAKDDGLLTRQQCVWHKTSCMGRRAHAMFENNHTGPRHNTYVKSWRWTRSNQGCSKDRSLFSNSFDTISKVSTTVCMDDIVIHPLFFFPVRSRHHCRSSDFPVTVRPLITAHMHVHPSVLSISSTYAAESGKQQAAEAIHLQLTNASEDEVLQLMPPLLKLRTAAYIVRTTTSNLDNSSPSNINSKPGCSPCTNLLLTAVRPSGVSASMSRHVTLDLPMIHEDRIKASRSALKRDIKLVSTVRYKRTIPYHP
jgi:hypothetical protein